MHKESTYLPSRSSELAYKFTEVAAIASVACPALLPVTLTALALAKRRYYEEVEETRERHEETECEADSIAETWESTRSEGETGLDVSVESSDGSGAYYSYTEDR